MRSPFKVLALVACALAGTDSAAADDWRIGLAAPLEGSMALLGRQMRDGAELAAQSAGAELVAADDRCSAEGGAAAARQFAALNVDIVVGFLCTEAIEAALPVLAEAGIPVVTPGVRADWLTDRRDRTGWPVWRMAPRADAEATAVSELLVRRWRNELFAIVDDGTIYGRDLSETLRLAVEMAGLQPVFVDTYRPEAENQIGLVGRLRRAGATHVFVGGDREDIAVIARDAAALDVPLTVAGGEAMRSTGAVPLTAGSLMVGLPEWADAADAGTLARFSDAGIVPEGYVVPAYAAMQVALRALEEARAAGAPLADILAAGTFDTLAGSISFDEKGDLAENPFRLLRYDGERFMPVE